MKRLFIFLNLSILGGLKANPEREKPSERRRSLDSTYSSCASTPERPQKERRGSLAPSHFSSSELDSLETMTEQDLISLYNAFSNLIDSVDNPGQQDELNKKRAKISKEVEKRKRSHHYAQSILEKIQRQRATEQYYRNDVKVASKFQDPVPVSYPEKDLRWTFLTPEDKKYVLKRTGRLHIQEIKDKMEDDASRFGKLYNPIKDPKFILLSPEGQGEVIDYARALLYDFLKADIENNALQDPLQDSRYQLLDAERQDDILALLYSLRAQQQQQLMDLDDMQLSNAAQSIVDEMYEYSVHSDQTLDPQTKLGWNSLSDEEKEYLLELYSDLFGQ